MYEITRVGYLKWSAVEHLKLCCMIAGTLETLQMQNQIYNPHNEWISNIYNTVLTNDSFETTFVVVIFSVLCNAFQEKSRRLEMECQCIVVVL